MKNANGNTLPNHKSLTTQQQARNPRLSYRGLDEKGGRSMLRFPVNYRALKSIAIGFAVTLLTALSGYAQAPVRLTSIFDTTYNTPDVFWLGTDRHLHIDYYNGSWHTSDVTDDAVAPPAAAGSFLTSLFDSTNHTPDVFYLGADQHVHILYFNGTWQTSDVTADAVAPPAAARSFLTSLFDSTNHTPDVFYLGTDQHVHILFFNGTWQMSDVTADAAAPPAAAGSFLTSLFDSINGAPDVFYLDTNQHVHILYLHGTWQTSDVTADAAAPPAAAGNALTSLLDTVNRTPDVFYLGKDQQVHILYFNGTWQTSNVTADAAAPPAAAGGYLTSLLDTIYGTPDVFYLDKDQQVHILYFNGTWQTSDVTADAAAPPAAAGSTTTSLLDTTNRTPDVFYVGKDQQVHILYFNGTWQTSDVTADAVTPQITVGITQTQIGPIICTDGQSFTPDGVAKLSYANIPGRTSPRSVGDAPVSPNQTFHYGDTSQEEELVSCSTEEMQQEVSVLAKDLSTGLTASTTVPGAYWCANATVATNYNGGCN
jgi:hypothetical protein